jgi:hypothetical protein
MCSGAKGSIYSKTQQENEINRKQEKVFWCFCLPNKKNTLSLTSSKILIAKKQPKMKRKDLKKQINYLCGELLAECIAAAGYSKKENTQDIENVMLGIFKMQSDLIGRLSYVEPGSTKLFFTKLKDDMQKRTDEIVDQIQNL